MDMMFKMSMMAGHGQREMTCQMRWEMTHEKEIYLPSVRAS